MLALVSILLIALILPHHTGECQSMDEDSMGKRFNFFDSGPCTQLCRAECGGICFFNTRTFRHDCNCAFKRSLG